MIGSAPALILGHVMDPMRGLHGLHGGEVLPGEDVICVSKAVVPTLPLMLGRVIHYHELTKHEGQPLPSTCKTAFVFVEGSSDMREARPASVVVLAVLLWLLRRYSSKDVHVFYSVLVSVVSDGACRELAALLGQKRPSCHLRCLRIVPLGQWGNCVFDIVGAAQYAGASGLKRVFFPKGLAFFQRSFMFNDIQFMIDDRREQCLESNFYYRPRGRPDLRFLNFSVPRSFREAFNESIGAVPLPDDTLVLHIRGGGDVMQPGRTPLIWQIQPPCAYYTDVMKKRAWRKVVVVSSCKAGQREFDALIYNPCLQRVKSHGAVHRDASWQSDLVTLLGAKHLAIARGTIGPAVMLLSYYMKTLYTFDLSCSRMNVHVHDNCVAQDGYIRAMLTYTNGTPAQLEMMRTSWCQNWEIIPFGQKDRYAVYVQLPDVL